MADEREVQVMQTRVMRFIFDRMRHVPMIDIGLSCQYLNLLQSPKKILRYISKIEELIEFTNPKLLKQVNTEAFLMIMQVFRAYNLGSREFIDKCASIL